MFTMKTKREQKLDRINRKGEGCREAWKLPLLCGEGKKTRSSNSQRGLYGKERGVRAQAGGGVDPRGKQYVCIHGGGKRSRS